MRIDFGPIESKLFKFWIPSTSALGGEDEDRIRSVTIQAAPLI